MATKASPANAVGKVSATNCTQGNELASAVIYIYTSYLRLLFYRDKLD